MRRRETYDDLVREELDVYKMIPRKSFRAHNLVAGEQVFMDPLATVEEKYHLVVTVGYAAIVAIIVLVLKASATERLVLWLARSFILCRCPERNPQGS